MIKRKVWIYYCSYCNKHYHGITHCKEHEEICFKNPRRKACNTCEYGGDYTYICGKTGEYLGEKPPVYNCKDHSLFRSEEGISDE